MATIPAMRAPLVDELERRPPDVVTPGGSRTWSLCSQNFVVEVTDLVAGDRIAEHDLPDEYVLLVPDGAAVKVQASAGAPVAVSEPSLVVVPGGSSTVQAETDGVVIRVFAAHSEDPMRRSSNYGSRRDPAVAPLTTPGLPRGPIRVHRMADVPDDPERLGRIFRTSSLMVNWFPTRIGPRDTEALTPHAHADFEQMSVTLTGQFVHDIRRPWTARMSEWRDDQHAEVGSPSMTLIPPQLIHTTRWTGPGEHVLIDVFAPPRTDFLAKGWVLNAADYPDED